MKNLKTIVFPLAVLLAGLFAAAPLFRSGYTRHFGSIEPVYFAEAKFFAAQFPNFSWEPSWYLGFPLRYLPNPLFIGLLSLTGWLLPTVEVSFIYRVICGLAYALVPVVFYFFVFTFTRQRLIATIAAFSFIFLPSVTYILPGLRGLAAQFSYPPFTLLSLVYFGSGPRTVGLVLELVGLIFILRILRNLNNLRDLYLGAFVAALIFLTDPVATVSFLIFSFILLLSEMTLGQPFEKLERWFWLAAAAFGLSAFWFNPSYLAHLFFSRSLGGAPFKNIFLTLFNIAIVAIPLSLGFFATKFGRKKENQIWVILSLWLGIFGFLFWVYYLENPEFMSEYVKFIPEIDLGVCLLVGVVGERIFSRVRSAGGLGGIGILGVLGAFGILGVFRSHSQWLSPQPSLAGRLEYEIAKWLEENVKNDERVYATGTIAFWLNALADVHQIRGGSDMSAVHPWWIHASYQIREGSEAELAVDWLKALGVSYVVVNDKSSAEFYHDYKHPEKFEGQIGKVYDNNKGDRIYKVSDEPLLAMVVSGSDTKEVTTPKNGVDSKAVGDYANWRMAGRSATFEWLSNREAAVRADLSNEDRLSLAIAYDPGWRAWRGGERLAISKDPIGNIFINPGITGKVEVRLEYHNPFGVAVGWFVTLVTLVTLVAFPRLRHFFRRLKPRVFDFEAKDEQEDY